MQSNGILFSPEIQLLNSIVNMPLMKLPVATPVITLEKAKLMISPGSQLTETQLRSAGPITDIVAPNRFHGAGVPLAAKVFPQARLWGTVGHKTHRPDIEWSNFLTPNQWPYQEEIKLIPLAGMPKFNEVAFVHRKSRTLILTDCGFNLNIQRGLGPLLLGSLMGTRGRFAMSRLFALFIKNKAEFIKSIEDILNQDFANILVSHGDPILGNGKERFLAILAERNIVPTINPAG